MISQNPNFLTPEEISTLVDYAQTITERNLWDRSDPHPAWHDRYVHAGHLRRKEVGFGEAKDLEIFDLMVDIRKRIKNHIINIRNLEVPLFADTLQLVRWVPGNEQHPHADSQNQDGTPHPYAWRDYASVTYLNDEYEGGLIYFPDHNIELKPVPGTMVTFPGTTEYMHGVSKVISGTRYTMASFWTLDPKKADGLPI